MQVLRHNIAMMATLVVVVAGLGLAGCVSDRPPAAPPHTVARALDVRPICGQVKSYSQEEQVALGEALEALGKDNPILTAMGDYKRMRDEARACQESAGPK